MRPGDVVWVELPVVQGHEQMGSRPAIVLQDDTVASGSPLVVLIPLTTVGRAIRFPGAVEIPPSPVNGLTLRSIALVHQIRALDRRRLRNTIGKLDDERLVAIVSALDSLLGRKTKQPGE
jgi:mRNA interferase MazF